MKLVRFGAKGHERAGILDARGGIRDASSIVADYDLTSTTWGEIVNALSAVNIEALPEVDRGVRIGPPLKRCSKIVCAGMNYVDHCKEAGVPIPTEPAVFMKAPSALAGPNDDIIFPLNGLKLDWEAELAVVIGSRASHVRAQDALDYVAGCTILNDVSERAFQLERGGQWLKGKSYDGFAPLGPWLVTLDEIADVQDLAIELDVNQQAMQRGSTGAMVFGVRELISHISQFMTLEPGDVVSTGTPPGVGMGFKPQRWLKPGDRVDVRIAGLGQQSQTVAVRKASV